jgi:XTP/dITP diphosphohydrolase
MQILIGTGNPAKFERYKKILSNFENLELFSLKDIDLKLPIIEDGLTAEANARKKAREYAKVSQMPVLSVDEALYIDALSPEEQPGTNVRRITGRTATDEELLSAFLARTNHIAQEKRTVTWLYAICLALPNGQEYFEQIELHEMFTNEPSLPMIPGYPLSSILFDPILGKTQSNFTPEEYENYLQPVLEKVRRIVEIFIRPNK